MLFFLIHGPTHHNSVSCHDRNTTTHQPQRRVPSWSVALTNFERGRWANCRTRCGRRSTVGCGRAPPCLGPRQPARGFRTGGSHGQGARLDAGRRPPRSPVRGRHSSLSRVTPTLPSTKTLTSTPNPNPKLDPNQGPPSSRSSTCLHLHPHFTVPYHLRPRQFCKISHQQQKSSSTSVVDVLHNQNRSRTGSKENPGGRTGTAERWPRLP